MRSFVFSIIIISVLNVGLGCVGSKVDSKGPIGQDDFAQNGAQGIYRGNNEHTGMFTNQDIDFPLSLKWKYFNDDRGIASAPVASGGMVFFGSFDKYIYAIDAATGQPKWRDKTGNSIITSLATADGTVYFGSMDGLFYAVDQETGKLKWSFETTPLTETGIKMAVGHEEPKNASQHSLSEAEVSQVVNNVSQTEPPMKGSMGIADQGVSSAPVVADGIVYFGTFGNRLYALNSENGIELWEFITEKEIDFSPTIYDGIVFFSTGHHLIALDAKTGQAKWQKKLDNGLGSTPVAAEGLILSDDGVNLMAINCNSGEEVWRTETGTEIGPDVGPSVVDGTVYVGNDKAFRALDLETGKLIWQNISVQPGSTGIPPAVTGNLLYYIDLQGSVDAFDRKTGELKGRFNFQKPFQPNWKTASPMILLDNTIFLSSMDGNLYAIEGA